MASCCCQAFGRVAHAEHLSDSTRLKLKHPLFFDLDNKLITGAELRAVGMKDDSKGQCNSIGTSRWHSAIICFLRDHDADLEGV